jgi:glycosyltransferase involved in cell wall biosynthesis
LSDRHHEAARALRRQAGGKTIIDVAFSQQATLSPEYIRAAREAVVGADVVIFSHPWVYPVVKDHLRANQIVIYDSHNVEAFLRAQLLDERNPIEGKLLRQVVKDEYETGRRADWILACSHEDLIRFNRLFGFSPSKMRVVPNGVMAFGDTAATPERRLLARAALGEPVNAVVGIFIGSAYSPNIEAAEFINQRLAPAMPAVTFVIAGGVGDMIKSAHKNVRITGPLDDRRKYDWFHASDFALNPMTSGSGTNIKMFDFMSMSLPVVTTAIGARGIDTAGREFMLVVEPTAENFKAAIEKLADVGLRSRFGAEGRKCVEDNYAWERISSQLGKFISTRERVAGQRRPLFSVVIPTYERHGLLECLMACLKAQIERDFEVIVVDQSRGRWLGADNAYGFPLSYFHSPVKGAIRARNAGAMIAQGHVIAFVDDDCEPSETWLLNARPYFTDSRVVGLEGLIQSDHPDDPDWRPVTNVGFEGLGFMTANLMVRSSVFQALGGFDLQFDRPHFREDTDLGWRMQAVGIVPYASAVKVFHPAQPRSIERESATERVRFFEKDALLYAKHPEKYRELFEKEEHYRNTPGFMENFLRGFELAGLDVPLWVEKLTRKASIR